MTAVGTLGGDRRAWHARAPSGGQWELVWARAWRHTDRALVCQPKHIPAYANKAAGEHRKTAFCSPVRLVCPGELQKTPTDRLMLQLAPMSGLPACTVLSPRTPVQATPTGRCSRVSTHEWTSCMYSPLATYPSPGKSAHRPSQLSLPLEVPRGGVPTEAAPPSLLSSGGSRSLLYCAEAVQLVLSASSGEAALLSEYKFNGSMEAREFRVFLHCSSWSGTYSLPPWICSLHSNKSNL